MLRGITRFFGKTKHSFFSERIARFIWGNNSPYFNKTSPFITAANKRMEDRLEKLSSDNVTFYKDSGKFMEHIRKETDKRVTKKYP